jgi:hypothetical protein
VTGQVGLWDGSVKRKIPFHGLESWNTSSRPLGREWGAVMRRPHSFEIRYITGSTAESIYFSTYVVDGETLVATQRDAASLGRELLARQAVDGYSLRVAAVDGIDAIYWRLDGDRVRVWTVVKDSDFERQQAIYSAELDARDSAAGLEFSFEVLFRGSRSFEDLRPDRVNALRR